MNYKLYENSLNDTERVIETILLNRGIDDPDTYLNLDSSCCNEYENLNNIEDAVKCLDKHLEGGDLICVLVDTDPQLDGYTSAAAIYSYIKRLDQNYPIQYIIHNNNKAHGLAKMGKGDFDIPKETKLLIIPDAGSNDFRQLNQLIQDGVDCICLDHHEVECEDPSCEAVIVNNQTSENYTCKDFSGVGIVYEFLKALDDWFLYDYADDFLDLVSFGNISDVMSIKNYQTRYYIELGMKNIKNKFLKALDKAQSYSTGGEINIHNIQWYWTPILNSIIRIGSYEDRDLLFRAFIETDEVFPYIKRGATEPVDEDIYTRAARLCKNAKSRQDKMRDNLCEELKEEINPDDKIIMLAAPDDADPGIIGLAAMRIADWASKPCIILKDQGGGVYSGSCRNFNHSPIKDFKELINNTKLFEFAQGHPNACGCSIYEENLMEALEALNDAAADVEYDDTIYCDFIIDAYDIGYDFIRAIDASKWLYGTGIEEPTVAVENICVDLCYCSIMGTNQDAVTFSVGGIKYCKFKCKEDDELLAFARGYRDEVAILNIVGKCSINTYKGNSTAQIIIDDYEIVNDWNA